MSTLDRSAATTIRAGRSAPEPQRKPMPQPPRATAKDASGQARDDCESSAVPVKEERVTQVLMWRRRSVRPPFRPLTTVERLTRTDRDATPSSHAEGVLMEEHRAEQRRRVLKAGTISFGGGGAISCTIRNLSETGAALEVESPVGIPDQLTLLVEAEHSNRHFQVDSRKETPIRR